jgi:hypothetical protein
MAAAGWASIIRETRVLPERPSPTIKSGGQLSLKSLPRVDNDDGRCFADSAGD